MERGFRQMAAPARTIEMEALQTSGASLAADARDLWRARLVPVARSLRFPPA